MEEKEKVIAYINDTSRVQFDLGLRVMVFPTNEFEGYTPIIVNKEDIRTEENGSSYLVDDAEVDFYEEE